MRIRVLSALAALFGAAFSGSIAFSGCINANPSTFYVDAGSDAARDVMPPPDDSEDAKDPTAACRACFAADSTPGPGCGEPFDNCEANENCLKIYECGYGLGCWSLPTPPEITMCGGRCFTSLGISLTDPALALLFSMQPCLLMACKPFCQEGASWPPGSDPNAACRSCFAAPSSPGPGCGEAYQACAANKSCAAIFDCGFKNGCWSMTSPTEVNACGVSCIQSLGLTLQDPGVPLLLAMQPCLFAACKPFCSEGAPWPPQ